MAALTITQLTPAGITKTAGSAPTASDTVSVLNGNVWVEYTVGATATTITVVNNGSPTPAGDAQANHVFTGLTNAVKGFRLDRSFADSSGNVTITTSNQTAVTVNAYQLA